jgi:hypothetical protein
VSFASITLCVASQRVFVISLSTQSGNFWIHTLIGGIEVYLHAFLTSALDRGERSASRPGRFTPRERHPPPSYPLDRRMGAPQSRSGQGVEEKNSQHPPRFESRSSDCSVRSQSPYRLSYPGFFTLPSIRNLRRHRSVVRRDSFNMEWEGR